MLRQSQFHPGQQAGHKPKGAADFLQSNDGLAALLPAVARMAALQKDCAALLPAMFEACDVLQYDADQLVLSTPNAALAAKLKQQLPKLQAHLIKGGWQLNVIRIKVQVGKPRASEVFTKQIELSPQALNAFDQLGKTRARVLSQRPFLLRLRSISSRRQLLSVERNDFIRIRLRQQRAQQLIIHRVTGFMRHITGQQRMSDQIQIADRIENLVAHKFVLVAQAVGIQYPVFIQHNRIFE
jgi:hypothetical protein